MYRGRIIIWSVLTRTFPALTRLTVAESLVPPKVCTQTQRIYHSPDGKFTVFLIKKKNKKKKIWSVRTPVTGLYHQPVNITPTGRHLPLRSYCNHRPVRSQFSFKFSAQLRFSGAPREAILVVLVILTASRWRSLLIFFTSGKRYVNLAT